MLIGRKHKYDRRSDRWYVIVDCAATEQPVDGLLPLVYEWAEDEGEAARSAAVSSMFNSTYQERVVGGARDSKG